MITEEQRTEVLKAIAKAKHDWLKFALLATFEGKVHNAAYERSVGEREVEIGDLPIVSGKVYRVSVMRNHEPNGWLRRLITGEQYSVTRAVSFYEVGAND